MICDFQREVQRCFDLCIEGKKKKKKRVSLFAPKNGLDPGNYLGTTQQSWIDLWWIALCKKLKPLLSKHHGPLKECGPNVIFVGSAKCKLKGQNGPIPRIFEIFCKKHCFGTI